MSLEQWNDGLLDKARKLFASVETFAMGALHLRIDPLSIDTNGGWYWRGMPGQASDIPVGGGAIYTAAKVVVTQPASGQYKAFSAVCTHVGCIVNKVTNGTIGCPCHGSEFKIINGAVVTGPAPSPLPAKQIKIVDGQVILL